MDPFPDSPDFNNLPSAQPVLEVTSKFTDSGSTLQTSSSSEKLNSSTENSIPPFLAAQRTPQPPIPVAPAIIPTNTPRPILIPDPSDMDPLTKNVARKRKSFKYRKPIDAPFCDKQTISALQTNNDEPYTSATVFGLNTASDTNSQIFSLLYLKLLSKFSSTSSIDGILNCESKLLSISTSNFLFSASNSLV